ncbi:MAG TPA: hypothetical protein VMV94_05290 [Phycisphaerae bacterium]|nr:hypothetical protein [Phycisphaerae bacterium]
MNPGPEQLERLIAERHDGTLAADERAWLDRALTADPATAALARQYERLHNLLAGWRTLHHDVDWQALADRIARRVAQDVERKKDAAVDDLVRESLPTMPEVDWDQFKARVSAAIRHAAATPVGDASPDRKEVVGIRTARRRWRRAATWVASVGAPLAAAAAIAIAVWWPGAAREIASPRVMPVSPMVVVALDVPQTGGLVAISFDQAPPAGYADQSPPPAEPGTDQPAAGGGLVIAVDSSAAQQADTGDDAMLY